MFEEPEECTMADSDEDVFRIERRGNVTIIRPGQQIETLRWDLIEQAADLRHGTRSHLHSRLGMRTGKASVRWVVS
jgi:hypothetical protein